MPTAREALLNAGLSALRELPWSAVRMVDVASAAGVSRQTLYNEFGSKEGLARALLRREVDLYLRGVERRLNERADTVDRLVGIAEWTVAEARARPLLRALLTGCWGEWLPAPGPVRITAQPSGVPAQRRADAGPPATGDLVALVRDRSAAALARSRMEQSRADHPRPAAGRAELLYRCELAVRLALAHLVAPGGESVGPLVRTAVTAPLPVPPPVPLSAPSPRAGAR
ncbi:TetR/AcrR family transcriptional regulator [Streptomyces sp. GMY02]|uniref:TetR/AcrR family transcriptional regulator n=1 Tax=Streptomyces sp. GMY02 TaxID=1333528 RepID=UPI001C2C7460|nr:TetR/AcrR family transcriptional regulator [Streptomyces sp. GMY02]QXE34815.1 TetR/AcrR family transcriptional regulator [Streptomyces sp. GMY02]